jgi:hypothetical protein
MGTAAERAQPEQGTIAGSYTVRESIPSTRRARVDWTPIMRWLLDEIKALDYSPSTRWCFYRVMDRYRLPKSAWGTFKATQSTWRKGEREGWAPNTLSDSARHVNYAGYGVASKREFYLQMLENPPAVGIWDDLPFYPEVWFEAEAMNGQFEHHVRKAWRITTRAFRGDYSIEKKYQAANDLLAMAKRGKSITILYFGDCDAKGKAIPYSALKDVKKWMYQYQDRVQFHVAGLTVEQAHRYGLPENFERPGQWQWEALSDAQAKEIIQGALGLYLDLDALGAAIREAKQLGSEWKGLAWELLLPPADPAD